MNLQIPTSWSPFLAAETEKPYFQTLDALVRDARASGEVYPAQEQVFRALELCPPEKTRVVILGQDPYHEPGQAHGLAFSVPDGTPLPPSLRNIFKELNDDLGIAPAASGDLTRWAQQGVLLLNTVLTVTRAQANSHKQFGWQRFTDAVIAAAGALDHPVAFVLWGAQAQKKQALITDCAPRLILCAPHPSPLSSYRGFFGSKPFSRINDFLAANNEPAIRW